MVIVGDGETDGIFSGGFLTVGGDDTCLCGAIAEAPEVGGDVSVSVVAAAAVEEDGLVDEATVGFSCGAIRGGFMVHWLRRMMDEGGVHPRVPCLCGLAYVDREDGCSSIGVDVAVDSVV